MEDEVEGEMGWAISKERAGVRDSGRDDEAGGGVRREMSEGWSRRELDRQREPQVLRVRAGRTFVDEARERLCGRERFAIPLRAQLLGRRAELRKREEGLVPFSKRRDASKRPGDCDSAYSTPISQVTPLKGNSSLGPHIGTDRHSA